MTIAYSLETASVNVYGKWDFVGRIKLMERWGDNPRLPGWAQCHPRDLVSE